MKSMQERLREHIEFHEAIDSHKSEAAFLREVLEHIRAVEIELTSLARENHRRAVFEQYIGNK